MGPINLSIYDFLLIFIFLSFFIHRSWKSTPSTRFPKILKLYLFINYFSAIILIILSSQEIPIMIQFGYLAKNFVIEVPYIILGYYALKDINVSLFSRYFYITSIIVGLYGIWVYYKGVNPYVAISNILYGSETDFLYFLEENRGGLSGRTSGTMLHPLTWGQIWNIMIAFYFIIRKHINNHFMDITIILLAIINIVLSGSRTSIVAVLVLIPFIFHEINLRKIIKVIPVFIIVIVTLSFLSEAIFDYIKSGIFFWDESYSDKANVSGSSVSMRMNQFFNSIEYANNNAIGGLGYNSIAHLGSQYVDENMKGFESVIFKKLYEQGFLGLIAFFIYYHLYSLFIRKSSKGNRKQHLMIMGYFISYLASICFTGIQNTWTLFILLPLCLCGDKHNHASVSKNSLQPE